MGAYLSTPVKEKEQECGGNERISYACISMQGWRIQQEDSHNCLIDFGEKSSLFAVYDGHGGSEVAVYISQHFPDFLRKHGLLSSDDITPAFQKCFVEFDSQLCNEKVIQVMNALKEKGNPTKTHVDEAEEREALFEEAVALSKEASVSLETIIKQYTEISRQLQDGTYAEGKSEKRALGEPSSRLVKRRRIHRENATVVEDDEATESTCNNVVSSTSDETVKVNGSNDSDIPATKKEEITGKPNGAGGDADNVKSVENELKDAYSTDSTATLTNLKNGNKVQEDPNKPHSTKSDTVDADTSTDEEEDDEDYEVDEEDDEHVTDECAESKEDDDDDDDDDVDDDDLMGRDRPGFDSGATACVALLQENRIVVANVGDSRAILCRGGKAIDLSTDHKPEDVVEKTRIEKAGGIVSDDGRVNGGLNLSRALGDHYYKQRTDLPLEEQMITARPDVVASDLTSEDTLLIIACDGIWNSLSSQEVVDFINEMLELHSLQEIGAQICEHCCAPDTSGDGTGCDNMTIIIVDLKKGTSNVNQ